MSEIEIPTSVVNEEAYIRYIKLKDSPVLEAGKRNIYTSNADIVIDPLILLRVIKSRLEPLKFTEQEEILKRVTVVKVLHRQMVESKAEAFGKAAPTSINTTSTESAMLFLDERSAEVLGYYGRYLSDKDIRKIIHVDWGMDIPQHAITKFRRSQQDKIQALQETFKKSTDEVRLSHKRGRLEEYTFLYEDRKRKYESTGARAEAELMIKILKQLKDEMHINSLNISGEVTHKIELTVAEHVEREIMGSLAINDIIIARAAFRMGVNPALLINRLHNSIYSKFSGFNTQNQDFMSEEVQYPSTMVYDWKAIAKKHKNPEEQRKEYSKFEEIKGEEKDSISNIRAELKAKLLAKKGKIDKIEENIEKNTD